jgi:hypothetical protein
MRDLREEMNLKGGEEGDKRTLQLSLTFTTCLWGPSGCHVTAD